MSWEWRVFCREEKNIVDQLGPLRLPEGSAERRTDIYIGCTSQVGIKWRGGRQVEIKVQTKRDESNGAEKWIKVLKVRSPVPCDVTNCEEIKHFLVTQFDRLIISDPSIRIQLEEAKTVIMSTPTIKLFELYKERSTSGCIEQVKITSPLGVTYQSISIEGKKDNIVKKLSTLLDSGKTVYQYLHEQGHICGYPEFVLSL